MLTAGQVSKISRATVAKARLSTDTTKVGAALVVPKTGAIIASSFNRLMEGAHENGEEIDEHTKDKYTIHAEAALLATCAKLGIKTEGMLMFVAGKCPCTNCAKLIIAAGIAKVFSPEADTNSRWVESNNTALAMFKVAGISHYPLGILKGIKEGLTTEDKYT